jgi:hypothetical protein
VVNIPNINSDGIEKTKQILEDEYKIRTKAVEFGVPVITNIELLNVITSAMYYGSVDKLLENV